jgi:predicted ATPase/DNA-binding SARP family transcriptional activator
MDFRFLGPLEVVVDGAPLPLGGSKQRALLALLLVHANEVVSREQAIDCLWEDAPPANAVNALQVHVHGLRKVLGRDRIAAEGTGYLLDAKPDEIDARRAERLVEEGRSALELGDPRRAAHGLAGGLALWRGQPLADLPSSVFVEAVRARLEEQRLQALELRIESELALDRGAAVLGELRELVAENPFRERLCGQLMLALYRAGQQTEALAVYRAAREALTGELGLEPGAGLRELQRAILRQDTSLDVAERLPDVRLPPSNTRLVGRRLEVAAVAAQLRELPLVTLTGAGGVGKTRIAIEVARTLAPELPDGVFFVDLAGTREPSQVPAAIAGAYGLVQAQGERTTDVLLAELRRRDALLVLDNFEQLLGAAPFVGELLGAAPRVRILVTSRTRLRIANEREYVVPPLDVPPASADLASLERNDATAVFVDRARLVDPGFRLTRANASEVGAVCRALEGVPLSLELAAARAKVMTPAQMLTRLARPLELLSGGNRDLPDRQQSLRATIDWSHDLLDPGQRRLLARLSVFVGGFTLEQAEAVCDATLEQLATLLDSSLLQREQQPGREPRFRMLGAVRDYAAEQLSVDDSAEVRGRHAEYFARFAERVGPDLVGPRAAVALELSSTEHDNLSAALDFAAQANVELGFRLVAALRSYWDTAARGREVRRWLERALEPVEAETTPAGLGALVVLGRQLINAGDYDAAVSVFGRAAAGGERLGRPGDTALALVYTAWLHANTGDHESAGGSAAQAIVLAQEAEDLWVERLGHAMFANTLLLAGDHAGARVSLDRSLAIARRLGDRSTLVLAMVNSGYGAFCAGDFATSRSVLEEALVIAKEHTPIRTVTVLNLLAQEANATGDHDRARAVLREALELGRDRGRVIDRLELLTEFAHALAETDPRLAARLLASADADYSRRSVVRPPPAAKRHERLDAALAGALPEPVYARELDDGALLTLDEAIDEALAHERIQAG